MAKGKYVPSNQPITGSEGISGHSGGASAVVEKREATVMDCFCRDIPAAGDDRGNAKDFDFVRLGDQADQPRLLNPFAFEQEYDQSADGSAADEARQRYLLPQLRQQRVERSVQTRNITGPTDDRQQIANPQEYPFSAVCSLEMRRPGVNIVAVGTGWLVGANLVLTAGHNLMHNDVLHGSPSDVRVYPGRNGRDGVWIGEQITDMGQLWVSRPWHDDKDEALDWGVIFLRQKLSVKAGSFGVEAWEQSQLLATEFNVLGYPSSQTHDPRSQQIIPYTQYYDVGEIAQVRQQTLLYKMDTTQGQSGAPILAWDGSRTKSGGMICVGIHNYGDGNLNQATRVTQPLIDQIRQMM